MAPKVNPEDSAWLMNISVALKYLPPRIDPKYRAIGDIKFILKIMTINPVDIIIGINFFQFLFKRKYNGK